MTIDADATEPDTTAPGPTEPDTMDAETVDAEPVETEALADDGSEADATDADPVETEALGRGGNNAGIADTETVDSGGSGAGASEVEAAATVPSESGAITSVTSVRSGRRSRLRAGAAALVVVLVAVAGAGWTSAKLRLGDARDSLAATRGTLAAQQDALAIAEHRAELTQAGIGQVQADIDSAVTDRGWLEALVDTTATEIAAVGARQAETATAQMLVAAHAADMESCFAGVSGAVAANRDGDDGTSADALRAAAGACSRTLAYATGARFPYDFPDPFVLATGGAYYAYSTNSGAGDIQVIRSSDLTSWELVGNALPTLPTWALPGSTWAPSVLARDGGYVVYYTVREAASRQQCISRAVADQPTGPFRDDSSGPLVCQRELGGSIDPSPFVDGNGRAYLLWKAEGAGGPAQTIWSQELTADGLALTGPAHALVSADRSFEHGVVEAPSLVHAGGAYHLVYAAADWNSRRYTAAVASCAGPAGPCTKPADGRVLSSGPRLAGPGGVEVFRGHDGGLWAAFHAFSEPDVGYPASRYLYLGPVRIVDGRLLIDAGT